MLRFKALDDRQVLIEEIYDELEAILLGREGNAEEEEFDEDSSYVEYLAQNLSIMSTDPNTLTEKQKKRYFNKLLDELLAKKAALEKALGRLDELVKLNTV